MRLTNKTKKKFKFNMKNRNNLYRKVVEYLK